jgi:hypothetical protein
LWCQPCHQLGSRLLNLPTNQGASRCACNISHIQQASTNARSRLQSAVSGAGSSCAIKSQWHQVKTRCGLWCQSGHQLGSRLLYLPTG